MVFNPDDPRYAWTGAQIGPGAPPAVKGAPQLPVAPTGQQMFSGGGAPAPGADPFAYTQGSLLTPWTQAFTPPTSATQPYQQFRGVGQFNYTPAPPPDVQAGTITGPGNFSYDNFAMPTAETMQQDPGYGFRLKQGTDTLQNAAAMRGSLRTGGALKALMDYGQNAASQEYQNAYGRARDVYGLNRTNAAENFDRNAANSLAVQNANVGNRLRAAETNAANALGYGQLGLQAYTAGHDRNYQTARQQYEDQVGYGNQQYDRALGEYMLGRQNFMDNQNNQFSRLMQMGQLGNPAGYAQSMADMYTGQGNANAAARMGQGNAWSNAFSDMGDLGMYAARNNFWRPTR